MYALLIPDTATGEPRLAESRGALIVGTRDEWQHLCPAGCRLVLVPDSIGPWVTATEVLERNTVLVGARNNP